MAKRYYEDIYFTNCNGKLYLHLDGAYTKGSGGLEGFDDTGFAYYKLFLGNGAVTYQSGYSGSGCDDWITTLNNTTVGGELTSTSEDDLKLEWNLNRTGESVDVYWNNYVAEAPYSDCEENNWWKDGLRVAKGISLSIYFFNSSDQYLTGGHVIGTNGIDTNGYNERNEGAVWIYNAPDGTSGRALVSDDNSGSSPYGVTGSPLQSMATTSGCTGDPHVTTFGGCKYTL